MNEKTSVVNVWIVRSMLLIPLRYIKHTRDKTYGGKRTSTDEPKPSNFGGSRVRI
jgi:hypothetical protein